MAVVKIEIPKFPRAGPSKEGTGWAYEQWRIDMGLGEGSSGSDDSTEMSYQEGCRRAAAERTKPLEQGLNMTGKGNWLVDAEERAKHFGEVEPPDHDRSPWEICIHVTVTGYSEFTC